MPNKTPKKEKPKKIESKSKKNLAQVENAFVIAQYFGFQGLDAPKIDKEIKKKAAMIRKNNTFTHNLLPPIEEYTGLLHKLSDKIRKKHEDESMLVYYKGKTTVNSKLKNKSEKVLHLHIIGTPKSIADILLIKTALSILEEEGYKDTSIEINHIGGKEAINNFTKELISHYRKNLSNMTSHCRQLFKDNVHTLVLCKEHIDPVILEEAPSPLSFLTDANRNHLKEIVEYLESNNISYQMNKDILGDPNFSSDTIFSILDKKTGKVLATGTRYNQLAKKTGIKEETAGATVTIKLPRPKKTLKSKLPKPEKKKFYFMQIGSNAKVKSLAVVDILRKAGIPIHQAVYRDKLSTQLEYAQRLKVPHIMLMGQKEAQENSVVIRDITTHKQITVPIDKLVEHIKSLKY